jgi:regulation of enolase protein 1 (concanavalin A-like superfamily)
MISTQKHGDWWENVLYSLVEDKTNIYVRDIGDKFWSEIDKIEDYHQILNYKMKL